MLLHKRCGMCSIAIRRSPSLLTPTEVSLWHVLITGEPQRQERALLVATITERLLLTEATPAP